MEELLEKYEAALDLLLDACAMQCWDENQKCYTSMAISAHADLIRFLAQENCVKITSDQGRIVRAVPINE